jgi:hypothetical protein
MARESGKVAAQANLKLVGKDDGDKQRALEAAIAQIDRAFGKGSVMKLGKNGVTEAIPSVSTGSLGLDMALGIGGLPLALGADHPVMVRLRADREALHDDLPRTLDAVLVLPMLLRTEVRGFILVGAKPSGEDYRPDEQETLAAAAQRIGMDLHALEIDRLEAEVRRLAGPGPARRRGRPVTVS